MTTQFRGTTVVLSDDFYDLTAAVSGTASVDIMVTVQGVNSLALIDTTSGTKPAANAAYNVIPPGVPVYVNAAHVWAKGLNGSATVAIQQIS